MNKIAESDRPTLPVDPTAPAAAPAPAAAAATPAATAPAATPGEPTSDRPSIPGAAPAAGAAPAGHANTQPAAKPAPKSVSQALPGFTAVKAMQQAILNFGKLVSGTDMFKKTPTGTGKEETGAGQYLGGHDPFSSFMFQNFLDKPGAKKPGSQYQDVDMPNGEHTQHAIPQHDSDSMRGWVSSMLHVGTAAGGGENKPDGQWGERTNHALENILAFANALVGFASAMGEPLAKHVDLKKFQSMIPPDPQKGMVHISNIDVVANEFAKQITALSQTYTSFKQRVLSVHQWAKMMSQEGAVFADEPTKLTTSEGLQFQSNSKKVLNIGPKTEEYKVTLDDLSSQEKFRAFIERLPVVHQNARELGESTTVNVADGITRIHSGKPTSDEMIKVIDFLRGQLSNSGY